eukprot:s12_g14.t1
MGLDSIDESKVTVYGACFCCFNGLNLENIEIGCAAKDRRIASSCTSPDPALAPHLLVWLRCFCLDIRIVPVTVCIKQQGQMCCLVSAAAIPPDAEVPMMLSVCFLVCFPKFGFFKKISEEPPNFKGFTQEIVREATASGALQQSRLGRS